MYVWYTAGAIDHYDIADRPFQGVSASLSDCEWMVPGTVDPSED